MHKFGATALIFGHLGYFCPGCTPGLCVAELVQVTHLVVGWCLFRVCVAYLVRATHLVVGWCVLCCLLSAGYTPTHHGRWVVPTLPGLHTWLWCGANPTLGPKTSKNFKKLKNTPYQRTQKRAKIPQFWDNNHSNHLPTPPTSS